MTINIETNFSTIEEEIISMMSNENLILQKYDARSLHFEAASGVLAIFFGAGDSRFSAFRLIRSCCFQQNESKIIFYSKKSYLFLLIYTIILTFSAIYVANFGIGLQIIVFLLIFCIVISINFALKIDLRYRIKSLENPNLSI